MIVFGIGAVWAGYAVTSFGWVLIKGWNITFAEWVRPWNTYEFPAGGAAPPPIPNTQVWPSPEAETTSKVHKPPVSAA